MYIFIYYKIKCIYVYTYINMAKENKLEEYTQTESLWEVALGGGGDFILVVKMEKILL